MSKIRELEDALRADPMNLDRRAELLQELREQLGYSAEEAEAHTRFVWVMAWRARRLSRAAELLREERSTRPVAIRLILSAVGLSAVGAAAFHIVTEGASPTVEEKPRLIAGEERTVVIRVPADWLCDAVAEQTRRPPHRPRRKGGG